MERLNKKQREILTCLEKVYPNYLTDKILLKELGYKPEDILAYIKILEGREFVTLSYGLKEAFPTLLTITPKGIEKLRENIITRLEETAYKNPWIVVAVLVSLISIGSNWYVGSTTEKIQVDLNEVKGKIAEYDTLIVKNATSNSVFVPCFNGTRPRITLDENGTIIRCVKE